MELAIETRAPTYTDDCLRLRRSVRACKPFIPPNWWRTTLVVIRCLDKASRGWRQSRADLMRIPNIREPRAWASQRTNMAIRVVVLGAHCIAQPSRSHELAEEAGRIVAQIAREG